MRAVACALVLNMAAAAPVATPDETALQATGANETALQATGEKHVNLPPDPTFKFTSAKFYNESTCTSDPINPFDLTDAAGNPVLDAVNKANFGDGVHPVGRFGDPEHPNAEILECSTNLLGTADATFACPTLGTLQVEEYALGSGCQDGVTASPVVTNGACSMLGLEGPWVKVIFEGACTPDSVHGDPMFQHDGKGQHFWIKEGVLTALLRWKSDDGHEMSLQGLTVANTETGHQWFKQIALMSDGKKVLSSEVVFDDKPTLALSSLDTSIVTIDSFVKGNGVDAKNVTGVSAGGMTFELTAESAHKFADTVQRSKYAHVNVKMPNGLAKDATGLFAELAGAQPMSDATKALLASPK